MLPFMLLSVPLFYKAITQKTRLSNAYIITISKLEKKKSVCIDAQIKWH